MFYFHIQTEQKYQNRRPKEENRSGLDDLGKPDPDPTSKYRFGSDPAEKNLQDPDPTGSQTLV